MSVNASVSRLRGLHRRRQLPAGMGPPAIDDKMDTRQPEQVLLDENAIAKSSGSSYLAVGTASVRCLWEGAVSKSLVTHLPPGQVKGWRDRPASLHAVDSQGCSSHH